jgi:hypothetical protein
LIHIAAYESRQNISCFAVQQTKQKIAAVASEPSFSIMTKKVLPARQFFILLWEIFSSQMAKLPVLKDVSLVRSGDFRIFNFCRWQNLPP